MKIKLIYKAFAKKENLKAIYKGEARRKKESKK